MASTLALDEEIDVENLDAVTADEATARQVVEDMVTAAQVIGITPDGYLRQLITKVCARFGAAGNPEVISWSSIIANAPSRLSAEDLAYLMDCGPAAATRAAEFYQILIY